MFRSIAGSHAKRKYTIENRQQFQQYHKENKFRQWISSADTKHHRRGAEKTKEHSLQYNQHTDSCTNRGSYIRWKLGYTSSALHVRAFVISFLGEIIINQIIFCSFPFLFGMRFIRLLHRSIQLDSILWLANNAVCKNQVNQIRFALIFQFIIIVANSDREREKNPPIVNVPSTVA